MRFSLKLVVTTLLVIGASGCATHPHGRAASLENWNTRHPDAARDLCAWANTHPRAAPEFFEWAGGHEENALELVDWAQRHPNRNIDVFVSEHPRWSTFDFISETHRPAANTFLDWSRRHPEAARALMDRSGGLKWAARHDAC